MKKLNFIIAFFAIALQSYSYNSLYINDPQNWMSGEGIIEKTKLTITPQGLYCKYDLEMDIAALNWYDQASDQLEIIFNFELPGNAKIIDSYLLVEDSMVRAELRDAWSANVIYESIVDRRQDPSILRKTWGNNYELRVYPLDPNGSRKVIISYLSQVSFLGPQILAQIPTGMLNASSKTIDNLTIEVPYNEISGKPVFANDEMGYFTFRDRKRGKYWDSSIDLKRNEDVFIAFNTPLKNGLFFSTHQTSENEGIYQLGILPSALTNNLTHSKILLVVDYDETKINISKKTLFRYIKQAIVNNLSAKDSFNIILSGLNPKLLSEEKISGDSASVAEALSNLKTGDLASYSMLKSTLVKGIQTAIDDGYNNILLLTSSDGEGNYKTANLLINNILELYSELPPLHTLNLSNYNTEWYYQGFKNYYGNEYFLSVLSTKTNGSYHSINEYGNFKSLLKQGLGLIHGSIINADLYTDCSDGFCYSRYFVNDIYQGFALNTPILQLGKYMGKAPFECKISGIIDNKAFSEEIEVADSMIVLSDSSLAQYYAGLYIDNLESGDQTNDIINTVIFESLEYRVLSQYTSFLALEPEMDADEIFEENKDNNDGFIDVPTWEENGDFLVSQEELIANIQPEIYPSPFTDKLYIDISHLVEGNGKGLEVSIVNTMGQIITVFDGEQGIITWDGSNDFGAIVDAGVYFVIVKTDNKIYKQKVVKI